jgi:uncharacterized protein YndB with AHSA1/START domain
MYIVVLILIVIVVLLLASKSSDTFHIERSLVIEAPAESLFPLINDFHEWAKWSPYEKIDAHMEKSFSGSESGVGAIYTWDGNLRAGAGRMEILESASPQRLVMKLDMTRPVAGQNTVTFFFHADRSGTEVVWAMDGKYAFLSKVVGVFFNMDRVIGSDFEVGLIKLKEICEKA